MEYKKTYAEVIFIQNKSDCCGCNACTQSCPKQCIAMKEDKEGFLYPQVDTNRCIDCGLCEKVCPVIIQSEERSPRSVYAAKNRDEEVRKQSSSGGVFTLLAEQVIVDGGVVFGACFDANWEVKHTCAETMEGVSLFRGSKYVQSQIGDCYCRVREFLEQGRRVLFSGTPCQIAGLRLFLRKEYPLFLLTVDFICHGVPSPKVWNLYKEDFLQRIKKKDFVPYYTQISFRNKSEGWKKYNFCADIRVSEDQSFSYREPFRRNLFMRGFLADLFLRPACYVCPAKSLKSGSDITLADYWGIQYVLPEIDDDRGMNAVMINTEKGQELFEKINVDKVRTLYTDVLRYNPSMEKSAVIPLKRKKMIEKMDKYPIYQLIWECTANRFSAQKEVIMEGVQRRLGIHPLLKKEKK